MNENHEIRFWQSNPSATAYSPTKKSYGSQNRVNQETQNLAKRNFQSQFDPYSSPSRHQVDFIPIDSPPNKNIKNVYNRSLNPIIPPFSSTNLASPNQVPAINTISPTLDPADKDTCLRHKIESLFKNKNAKKEVLDLLSELYDPLPRKSIETIVNFGCSLADTHNVLSNLKEENHGPLTKALTRGCSKKTVLELYQSQVLFTENLLSLVIVREEALCIFPDMLKNYIDSGKPLRYKFVEQACQYKRPIGVVKTLIESFKNPDNEKVCAFFSAALYYEYCKIEPEILPYLMSKFTKTHEQAVLAILTDLPNELEFTHALPQLPSLVTSFINEGGTWSPTIIESVLDNRSLEDAKVLIKAMIDSKKTISQEDLELAFGLCSSEDTQTLLLSTFLERGGKASSQLLKRSLSSPYTSSKIVEPIILELIKELGCLTQEQANMTTDHYFTKEKQDLLLMYGPAGTTISL